MLELWPFTNFHDLNLDWIIQTIKDLQKRMEEWQFNIKNYVLDLLSDHPEWIQNWMLDDGTVTRSKLAPEFDIMTNRGLNLSPWFVMTDDISTIANDADIAQVQGGCYNPLDRLIYQCLIQSGNTKQVIVAIDPDTKTVQRRASFTTLQHGNDFTVNTATNKLLTIHQGLITELDLTSLTVTRQVQAAGTPNNISYDASNNTLVATGNTTVYIYDADTFTTVDTFTITTTPYMNHLNGNKVSQAACVYKNLVFKLFGNRVGGEWVGNILTIIDLDQKKTIANCQINNLSAGWECEWLDVIDNAVVIGFGVYQLSYGKMAVNELYPIQEMPTYYTGTYPIPSGTDLDEIFNPGHYSQRIPGLTIYNLPTTLTGPISLDIRSAGKFGWMQELYDADSGRKFSRYWNESSYAWGDWSEYRRVKHQIVFSAGTDNNIANMTVAVLDDLIWINISTITGRMNTGDRVTIDTWSNMGITPNLVDVYQNDIMNLTNRFRIYVTTTGIDILAYQTNTSDVNIRGEMIVPTNSF